MVSAAIISKVAAWLLLTLQAASALLTKSAPVIANQCAFEEQSEYFGKSFRKVTVEDPGQCCSACRQDSNCNYWTYLLKTAKQMPKTCFLLKEVNGAHKYQEFAMVSGIRDKQKALKPNVTFEDGVDFQDKTLYKLNAQSADECARFCASKLLCKAISFAKKQKICYAKLGNCCQKKDSNAISAVV